MNIKLGFFVILSALISACGGGGGGEGSSSNVPAAEVPVTEDNAQELASLVVGSGLLDDSFGEGFLDNATFGSSSGSTTLPLAQHKQTAVMTGHQDNEFEMDCSVSGTMVWTFNVANENEMTPGDSIGFRFNNCDEGDGEITNGSLVMTFTSAAGIDSPGGDSEIGLIIEINSLQTSGGEEDVSIDGSMSILVSTSGDETTSVISSNVLNMTQDNESIMLSNYSVNSTYTNSTGDYEISTSGTIGTDQIGGTISFTNIVPFAGNEFDDYPSSGELLINGANDSTLRLVVLNNVDVSLELDIDGDGVVDTTIVTSWQELEDSDLFGSLE